jgi:hypothetical protein
LLFLLSLLVFDPAYAEDSSGQAMPDSRGLTVSVEMEGEYTVDGALFFEIESETGKLSMSLRDNGEPPDVIAGDNKYSGVISVYDTAFRAALLDELGGVIWEEEDQSIPSDFEMPALRIVVSETGATGSFVDDIDLVVNFVPELDDAVDDLPEYRTVLVDLRILAAIAGFLCGVLAAIVVTRRRRDPITSERRLELVELGQGDDRAEKITDLVGRASENGPVLLVSLASVISQVESEVVGVVSIGGERPTVAELSRFVSGTLMFQGRAVTVIDGAKSIMSSDSGDSQSSLLNELERCIVGVVYFVA